MTNDLQLAERRQMRTLRVASLLEASSLILLVFVAVPLKHLAGRPEATAIMGPLHGLSFLFYLYVVVETVSGSDWSRKDVARLILMAFVPFGGLANLPWLERKASQREAMRARA